jgi:hypothetical protein
MEESVRKELEILKGMVLTWKKDYLGWTPSEGGEFLAEELRGEIETHVYPHVKRLYECDYLSGAEAREFLDFCYQQVEDLRNAGGDAEIEELPAKGG